MLSGWERLKTSQTSSKNIQVLCYYIPLPKTCFWVGSKAGLSSRLIRLVSSVTLSMTSTVLLLCPKNPQDAALQLYLQMAQGLSLTSHFLNFTANSECSGEPVKTSQCPHAESLCSLIENPIGLYWVTWFISGLQIRRNIAVIKFDLFNKGWDPTSMLMTLSQPAPKAWLPVP